MSETRSRTELEAASVSDRGLNEKRPHNEDSFLLDAERRIFAVADGVGGAEAGEVASRTAVEVLQEAFRQHQPGDDAEDLMELAIQRANASIYHMSREQRQLAMMATTVVALHLDGYRATIAHVGDSRLYRVTPDGRLHRETDDHSVVEEEVRAGRMTAEQAANHPSRNVISRALGAEPSVEVDTKTVEVEDGTVFLLCSDGITRHLRDAEISDLLRGAASLEEACAEMKRLCFARGAEDNLTAVAVRVGERAQDAAQEVTRDNSEERTLSTARVAHASAGAAAGAAVRADGGPSLLQRPFHDAGAANSPPPPARSRVSGKLEPLEAGQPQEASQSGRGEGGGRRRLLPFLLLLLIVGGAAFYGGTLFQQSRPEGVDEPAPAATPAGTPETPEARYERLRRAVDQAPRVMAAQMTGEANGQPLASSDPEFLYLYGRALLLSGKSDEAVSAFNLAVQKIDERAPRGREPLKVEARIATAAALLKSNRPDPRAASSVLDEVIERDVVGGSGGATTPAPQPTR